ncbi:MAG: cell division protein FtsH, partial [Candidatus Omnitrophica bacterium]|nr:cell division protein FtsH [Candidatus Omnitrophota bacterium]
MSSQKQMGNVPKIKRPGPAPKNNQLMRSLLLWALISMGLLWLYKVGNLSLQGPSRKFSYSEFYQMAAKNKESGQIQSAVKSEGIIEGKLSDGSRFTVNVPLDDEVMLAVLRENVQDFYIKSTSWLSGLLYSLGPMMLFIFFLWFFFYRGATQDGGRLMAFGKSRAKEITSDRLK